MREISWDIFVFARSESYVTCSEKHAPWFKSRLQLCF